MEALQHELYMLADELRAMAGLSKLFASDVHEQERAARMQEMAAKIAALVDERPASEIKAIFDEQPWHRFSPALGCDAFVVDEHQRLLLIQRRDNGQWAMPGGIAEVGLTLPETALKELWEEAGLRGRVQRLLGVFDGRLWQSRVKSHSTALVYLVECADLNPSPGIECLDARFVTYDDLPNYPLFTGHNVRIPRCYEAYRQGETHHDPADSSEGVMPDFQRRFE
jgi:8-oxo-dGTP pyrophosphatase MutT (NUDIX family)